MESEGIGRGGNGGSSDENGESSEDSSDGDSDRGEVAGDSEGESDEDEAERKGIQKEMQVMAQQLHDLASVVDYNAQYTDRRALEMFTQKTKASMSLIKKVQKLEKLVRSHTLPNLPTFSPAFADLMFVRTRPRALTTQV
jgi:cobalamin biosynthesis protein CobT